MIETAQAFIEAARTNLEAGGTLLPLAFVGCFDTGKMTKIFLDADNLAGTAETIRGAAIVTDADFVFLMEPSETGARFSIETPAGVWAGDADYLPHQEFSTFAPVALEKTDEDRALYGLLIDNQAHTLQ
jgi:hypothetical protein